MNLGGRTINLHDLDTSLPSVADAVSRYRVSFGFPPVCPTSFSPYPSAFLACWERKKKSVWHLCWQLGVSWQCKRQQETGFSPTPTRSHRRFGFSWCSTSCLKEGKYSAPVVKSTPLQKRANTGTLSKPFYWFIRKLLTGFFFSWLTLKRNRTPKPAVGLEQHVLFKERPNVNRLLYQKQ